MPREEVPQTLEAAGRKEKERASSASPQSWPDPQPQLRPGSCAVESSLRMDLSVACSRMRRAVVCLETAAYMLGLADGPTSQTWLALPQGSRASRRYEERWHVIYWTDVRAFEVGVVMDRQAGMSIRTTDRTRTIVDLVRCRRYFRGLAPAYQAARRYVDAGHDAARLLTMATELRLSTAIMRNLQLLVDDLQGRGWAP